MEAEFQRVPRQVLRGPRLAAANLGCTCQRPLPKATIKTRDAVTGMLPLAYAALVKPPRCTLQSWWLSAVMLSTTSVSARILECHLHTHVTHRRSYSQPTDVKNTKVLALLRNWCIDPALLSLDVDHTALTSLERLRPLGSGSRS
jgi:hypothetical protein